MIVHPRVLEGPHYARALYQWVLGFRQFPRVGEVMVHPHVLEGSPNEGNAASTDI